MKLIKTGASIKCEFKNFETYVSIEKLVGLNSTTCLLVLLLAGPVHNKMYDITKGYKLRQKIFGAKTRIAIKYYKIIDLVESTPKFLYHGLYSLDYYHCKRSRDIVWNKWLTSENRFVKDGTKGRFYHAGFHIFKNLRSAKKYLKKFKKPHKKIAIVNCRDIRPKMHSNSDVYLSEQIKFIGYCE